MPAEPSTDSVLGDQGSQDFTSLTANPSGTGGGDAGGSNAGQQQQLQSSGSNLPNKTAEQSAADQGQGQQQQIANTGTEGQQQQIGQQQTNTGAAQPTANQVLGDIIAEAVAKGTKQGADLVTQQQGRQQQQQATASVELTPEQFDKKYAVARPTPQLIAAIQSADPKVATEALHNYGQGIVKQTALMVMELVSADTDRRFGEIQPHIKSWQSHEQTIREEKAEKAFFVKYPDLANEKELVMEMKDAVLAKMASGQLKVSSMEQGFEFTAQAARAIMQRYRPQGGGNAGGTNGQGQQQQQSQNGQSSGRTMSAASSAGRTGTGQQGGKKSAEEEVFGADFR